MIVDLPQEYMDSSLLVDTLHGTATFIRTVSIKNND